MVENARKTENWEKALNRKKRSVITDFGNGYTNIYKFHSKLWQKN